MAGPINTEYFEGLQKSIEGCASCEQLTEVVNDAFESVGASMTAGLEMLPQLEALQALLEIPAANPAEIVTWITSLVEDYLTPQFQPLFKIPVQLALIQAQMAELPALIEAKMAQFPSCSVPIPPLPPVP